VALFGRLSPLAKRHGIVLAVIFSTMDDRLRLKKYHRQRRGDAAA